MGKGPDTKKQTGGLFFDRIPIGIDRAKANQSKSLTDLLWFAFGPMIDRWSGSTGVAGPVGLAHAWTPE